MTRHVREVTLKGQARPVGHLPATQTMRLVLVLPLRNQAELDNLLQELYDPSSLSYRHFLTVEEFTSRFGPTPEDYDSVIHFAEANGLTVVGTSRNRVNLEVTGSVASIEQAFHINLGVYQHPTEKRTFFAPDREPTPYLPFPLWHIAGLDNYSLPHPNFVRRAQNELSTKPNAITGSGPSASFLGSDMRAAYYGGTLTGSGQSLGLLEFVGTDLADLKTYYTNVGQTYKVPTLLSTDGTPTSCIAFQGCDDTEQTLDMTQALGMAPGLTKLVMYIGSSDPSIFNAMATASPLNAQLSSSWTWFPADPATDNPFFQEFAAQGQNLFQASGDNGAWNSTAEIFPADDALVTALEGRTYKPVAQEVPGVQKPLGLTVAAAFRLTNFRSLPIRRPPLAAVPHVPKLCATARTFRPTQILLFTFAPTNHPALRTNLAEQVLQPPCGPATWRS